MTKRHDPAIRSLLAAEYVLGTLQGPARIRFERLLAADGGLQREVATWEAQLHELLTRDLAPEAPPEEVHGRIMQRLAAPAAVGRSTPRPRRQRRRVWVAAAVAASAAVVALLLPERVEHTEPPELVQHELQPLMRIELAEAGALWTVGLRGASPVVAAPEEGVSPPEGSDYELWWVDPEGTPHSLGVLPRHGERFVTVPAAGAGLDSGALAISREPEGGAPEGAPSEVLEVIPL